MKQKFQKQLLSLCLFLLSAATLQSYAQRADYLYLYSPGGAEQSFSLDEIRKITFTEQNMQVHPSGGGVMSILYDNIARLTFASQEGSGIDVPLKEAVKIYFNAAENRVIIESPLLITAVSLYNLQGALLQCAAPQSLSTDMSLSGFPAGVYVVQVSNGQGVNVGKIIKN
jgi:hypothetical protein